MDRLPSKVQGQAAAKQLSACLDEARQLQQEGGARRDAGAVDWQVSHPAAQVGFPPAQAPERLPPACTSAHFQPAPVSTDRCPRPCLGAAARKPSCRDAQTAARIPLDAVHVPTHPQSSSHLFSSAPTWSPSLFQDQQPVLRSEEDTVKTVRGAGWGGTCACVCVWWVSGRGG